MPLHNGIEHYFFDPGRRIYCIREAFFYKAGLITGWGDLGSGGKGELGKGEGYVGVACNFVAGYRGLV